MQTQKKGYRLQQVIIPKDSVHRILHIDINDDDPDRRVEFCEWCLAKCKEYQ